MDGTRQNICGSLLVQETIFGWILSGLIFNGNPKRVTSLTTQAILDEKDDPDSLDALLRKF